TKANTRALASDFTENASVSVNLFGFIPLGTVSQSYQVSDVKEDAQSGSITISFGPSEPQAGVDTFDYAAYLLAGLPAYPPEESELPVLEKAARNVDGPLVKVYQCFRTLSRDTYCSSYKVSKHAEGAIWMGECMEHHGITAADLLTDFQRNKVPNGATLWP
ncbi:MAG: hypothetical protein ACREDL_16485, partial [Bradyrhizobium sp.]